MSEKAEQFCSAFCKIFENFFLHFGEKGDILIRRIIQNGVEWAMAVTVVAVLLFLGVFQKKLEETTL